MLGVCWFYVKVDVLADVAALPFGGPCELGGIADTLLQQGGRWASGAGAGAGGGWLLRSASSAARSASALS